MLGLLVSKGVSTSDARLALELAAQAKLQALESIKTVGSSVPAHLKVLVTALAIDSLSAVLSLDEVEDVTVSTLIMGILLAAAPNKEEKAN